MSLFKVRELWTTKCGKDEVFEISSLLIADIRGQSFDDIIVGSHSGYLRIFNPQLDLEAEEYGTFKAIDQLIEIQLEEPILQIAVGKLVSGSKVNHLAILHPRSVAVYNVITKTGSTEHGDQCQINIVYEHHLKRSAYSFLVGGFGGVEGRDFLCVLGLDGTLMFYEQETLSLTRLLPNFLLPSPIVYVPHTDSFVLLNSNWHIESYRYQILGEESADRVLPSWSHNLGEDINDMRFLSLTTNEAAIFILTERNFYCFGETGILKFCKRLQYIPLCCHVYSRGEPSVMSMIVSDSNNLLIYEGSKLKWGAQLNATPVAICRASLESLQGCLVILTEEGELQCAYLGTEPTVFVPPPIQNSVLSNAELESKYASLQHQIATYSKTSKESLGAPTQKSEIKLTTKIWPMSDTDTTCGIEIYLTTGSSVHNVNIMIEVSKPLLAEPATHFIQTINDSVEVASKISVSEGDIWDLNCNIVCTYLSEETFGVVSTDVELPVKLVLELATPSRGQDISLNFTATQVVILSALFSDYSADSWNSTNSNEYAAGFRYRNNPSVTFTLTLNRPGLKYRLEGDSVTSLTLPVCILAKKLASKHLKSNQYSVGLNELFNAVDENIRLRNIMRETETELRLGSGQMRSAQRRLLSKMRDKTPCDMKPLSALIAYTHEFLMDAAHKLEGAQIDLNKNSHILANLLKFTFTMIKMTGTVLDDELKQAYEAICNTQHLSEDQGWAEITQFSLSHLLKTTLARSVRDQFTPDPHAEVVTNSFQLKKKIAIVIDRLLRGHRPREDRAVSPIMEDDEEGKEKRTDSLYDELESEEIRNLLKKSQHNLDHL
ncbi:protein PTHB1 isoform X2 [Halyomorpha halys]|uniref:protein PTHB1 isoform X2 n=1 Tax=Halyomorpha halys TaxID=286706 RepID=UPI0006D50599|nr:protein PTHB1 isoform X1 [Halyomorpha halys]